LAEYTKRINENTAKVMDELQNLAKNLDQSFNKMKVSNDFCRKEFLNSLKLLRTVLNEFIEHLEPNP